MLKNGLCAVLACLLSLPSAALELDGGALERAVAADPQDLRARLVLARHYLRQGVFKQAREQVDAAQRIDPQARLAVKLERQLNALDGYSAELRQIGLANPYDQERLSQVVTRLYTHGQFSALDALLTWLGEHQFQQPESVREIHARRLQRGGGAEQSPQTAASDQHRPPAAGPVLDEADLRAQVSSLYNNNQREAALVLLDRHLDQTSPSDQTRYFAAERYAWEARYGTALKLLAGIAVPTDSSRLMIARIHAWRGDLDSAKRLLEALMETSGDRDIVLQSRMMMGFSHHWGGDTATALTYFEPLLVIDSPVLDRVAMQEVVLLARGEVEHLIAQAEARLAKQPDNAVLVLRLADLSERKKAFPQAQQYYERYLELKPDNHAVRKRLGLLYISRHDYDSGFLHLERYALQRYSADSLFELAQQYYWAQRYDDAMRQLDQLLRQFPDEARAVKLRGQIRREGKLVRAAGVTPGDRKLLQAAITAFDAQRYQQAAEQLDHYLQRYPADMQAHYYYAFALASLGSHTAAASEFYIVSRSHLTSDEVLYHYGYNLSRSGNYRAARRVLKKLELKLETGVPSLSPLTEALGRFVDSWQASWQARDFVAYQRHYARAYAENPGWVRHKSGVLNTNQSIEVVLSELGLAEVLKAPEGVLRYRVQFIQDYRADHLRDRGQKHLLIDCQGSVDEPVDCHIVDERWTPLPEDGESSKNRAREESLLKNVRQALEALELSAQEKSPKDQIVNTIYFAEGVGKVLRPESDVLSHRVAQAVPAEPSAQFGLLGRDLSAAAALDEDTENKHTLAVRYRAFHDSDGVAYRRPEISLQTSWGDYRLQAALAPYTFSEPRCGDGRGVQLDLNGERNGLTLGTQLNELRDRVSLTPYLRYRTSEADRFSAWHLGYSPLFFDKLSCGSLGRQLTRLQLAFSQYRLLADSRSLWYSLSLGRISDDNIEGIAQFDYVFHQQEQPLFEYKAGLNGWYLWNSQPAREYYSPAFYDSSRLRLEASLKLGETLDLVASTGFGYTLAEHRALYDYGLRLDYPVAGLGAEAQLGCRKSNAGRAGETERAYLSTNCTASLEYQW